MKRLLLAIGAFLLFSSAIVESAHAATKTVIFAGGCFWCMQPQFDQAPGVIKTMVGYSGGTKPNPTYEEVSEGNTGHKEVIQVTYDPAKTSFADLVDLFWYNIDPTDDHGQFCDKGEQYVAAIFYNDETEHKIAEESVKKVETKINAKVATQILPAMPFYPAEDYHQKFYQKNELRYQIYSAGCGRKDRLKEVWGAKAADHK